MRRDLLDLEMYLVQDTELNYFNVFKRDDLDDVLKTILNKVPIYNMSHHFMLNHQTELNDYF